MSGLALPGGVNQITAADNDSEDEGRASCNYSMWTSVSKAIEPMQRTSPSGTGSER